MPSARGEENGIYLEFTTKGAPAQFFTTCFTPCEHHLLVPLYYNSISLVFISYHGIYGRIMELPPKALEPRMYTCRFVRFRFVLDSYRL